MWAWRRQDEAGGAWRDWCLTVAVLSTESLLITSSVYSRTGAQTNFYTLRAHLSSQKQQNHSAQRHYTVALKELLQTMLCLLLCFIGVKRVVAGDCQTSEAWRRMAQVVSRRR